jgi:hypothetical protein
MGNLMWYEWDNLESFNAWHDDICQTLGIPNEQTLNYTLPFEVKDKVIAVVNDSESDGLTITNLRPPKLILENDVNLS